jgi:glycosyltransferase involved in cell wall biosynthesis
VPANLRSLGRQPSRYLRVLLEAAAKVIRHRRWAALRHFFKAGYLVDMLVCEPVDHLHAHFASTPTLVAMFAHQLCGIPYTFTAHAKDIYVNDPDTFRVKLERAQAVVTCTEYNRRFLVEQFGSLCQGKLHCIYHGLDTRQFNFTLSRANGSSDPTILAVARLVEKKGLGDLIAAADILRRRGRSCRLEIIGSGSLRGALEAQVRRLGLEDRIELLGAQAHDAVCRAYQRASVFVLPCVIASNGDRDGIPNVLLEAMASGVPVISTAVSGVPELIESGADGLLVPPENPARLAEAINRLLASRELREGLARAGRAKIEASFSLDTSAERLLVLFGKAAGEKRRQLDICSRVAAEESAPIAEGS